MTVSYRQIKTFLTIAKTNSMRAAAQLCYLTQPAVTKQMKLFEENVGKPLFYYNGKKTLLTDTGQQLLQAASNIDHAFENFHQQMAQNKEDATHTITIITTPSTEDIVLEAYIRFHQQHPEVVIKMEMANNTSILNKFYLHHADLIISTQHIEEKEIVSEKIGQFEFSLVACQKTKYPINRIKKEAEKICFISLLTSNPGYQKALKQFHHFEQTLKLSSSQSVKNAILNDLGIGLLPSILINHELLSGKLIEIPYQLNGQETESFYMSMRKSGSQKDIVKKFFASLQQSKQ